ncbi:MATE family efflux transporter [Eubacteriales bacterium OttesenSCG-928-K08]|nr:MATE family efflux transporter [Eubacteriales bacterium OttesenSCG-928-K08]
MTDKHTAMTTQPVSQLIFKLAGPSIMIMLVSSLYNMADTYFVSELGTSSTGAIGISYSLMAIIQAIGFFFGHGSGNYMARQLGAQKGEDANSMASLGLVSSICVGIVIAVLGNIFLSPLARALGATDTILPYAKDYLRFILIGAPWMAGAFTLNNQLRYQGSSFYGMIGIVSGAVLNIALDPLFIFTLNMGVQGAALATGISQMVSFILLFLGTRKGGNAHISLRSCKPSLFLYKEMLRGGLPSLCRQGLASIAAVVLNRLAGAYGDAAIAAIAIVQKVVMLAAAGLLGFGQGFQPVCGFNYGAGLYHRVKQAFWFCIKFTTIALCLIGAVGFATAPTIMSLFRVEDPSVMDIGIRYLRISCCTFPFLGFVIISNMMLQTIGMSTKASILAMARQGLFFLPFVYLLSYFWGLQGLLFSQPAADILSFILAFYWGTQTIRKMEHPQTNATLAAE